jgi:hypothetical protein
LAGYVHIPFNDDIFSHVNLVPFPHDNSIIFAFSHAGETLHVTLVLHHQFQIFVFSMFGLVHINSASML